MVCLYDLLCATEPDKKRSFLKYRLSRAGAGVPYSLKRDGWRDFGGRVFRNALKLVRQEIGDIGKEVLHCRHFRFLNTSRSDTQGIRKKKVRHVFPNVSEQ